MACQQSASGRHISKLRLFSLTCWFAPNHLVPVKEALCESIDPRLDQTFRFVSFWLDLISGFLDMASPGLSIMIILLWCLDEDRTSLCCAEIPAICSENWVRTRHCRKATSWVHGLNCEPWLFNYRVPRYVPNWPTIHRSKIIDTAIIDSERSSMQENSF